MDLENYYKLNFAFDQYHKYSLTEIENMMPWERDIYVILLQQHLEEEEENRNKGRMDRDLNKRSSTGGKISSIVSNKESIISRDEYR